MENKPVENLDIDDILDETVPSLVVRKYLKEHKNILTDDDICEIILGSPISIFNKKYLLQALAEKDADSIFADRVHLVEYAIEELKASSDEVFCLCGYCNENGERVQFESMPIHDYKKGLAYLSQDELADNIWYVLEKWKLDNDLNYDQTLSYTIIDGEVCYFYNVFNTKKGRYKNYLSDSVNLNLPVPFSVGDIIKVDCTPFAPVQNVLITEIGDNKDCCCVQGLSVDTNGNMVTGALKHGTCIYDGSHNIISPLYRAERVTDFTGVDKKLIEERNKLING
jgi:hypothetical protein